MKIRFRHDEILSNMCLFFVVLHILNYKYAMLEEYVPIVSVGYIIVGLISLYYYRDSSNIYNYIIIFVSLLCGILNFVITGNITTKILLQDCFLWSMSFPLSSRKYSEKGILATLIIIFGIFIYDMIRGISPNLIMNGVSRNYISVVVLLILILYYSQVEFINKTVSIIPATIGFLLAVYGESRSGIVALGFLTLGVLYYKYYIELIRIKIVAYAGLITIACLIGININKILAFFTLSFTGFAQNGLESIRTIMWTNYLNITKSNGFYLIFGAPLNAENYQFFNSRYGMNLHNSFMSLHEYYGLIMFVLIIIVFTQAVRVYKKEGKVLQIILMISLLIRSFTDNMLFSTHNVPVFGFFIFYAMRKIKLKQHNSKINYSNIL